MSKNVEVNEGEWRLTGAVAAEEAMACPVCGGNARPCWTAIDGKGRGWPYVRCQNCGLVRLDLRGIVEEWKKLAYGDEYYAEGISKFTGAVQLLREFSAWRRAREIHGFFGVPGRVLDIGCGEGLFLKAMQNFGWQVDGCETGQRPAERAEQLLGRPVCRGGFCGMLESGVAGPWDVVMLWHVLEHVAEPRELLERLAGFMKPGGRLVVAVPNAASWQARIFGVYWFHLDPPRHLYHLEEKHVRMISRDAGWEIDGCRHFSLEYGPFGWAQSFLNVCHWRRDAMYETLKRSKGIVKGGIGWRALAWLLLGPSVLPAALEAMAGRGGSLALFMKRK
ncbi:MAG: class I SAM-dependent methyltransferase [Verrucomicrobiae bacterium]|nr:class I SAM-dependent methyltransferase [Verrucomicrobiae bacterium]